MISQLFLTNLTPWWIQSLLLATIGALLPLVFRIRHPRSQLAYYHAVLFVCFALPLIQPWQQSIAIVTGLSSNSTSEASFVSWETIALAVLIVGISAKLGWLVVGLYQLRRYRRNASPLKPLPDSIREARRLTGADARFCLSPDVAGPATLGHIDPVVLLPESFRSLDADSQRSIACHELLHVRREDWLATILEEIVGALLWFNPGVWWLIAQAKLAREQLVDAEVVKLTAREPYIEALLSMAVVSRRRWALPAAPFFTEGHLVRRMRLLLSGQRRSLLTLCVSYSSIAMLLALVLYGAFLWFPLVGESHLVLAAPAPMDDVILHVSTPPIGAIGGSLERPETFTIAVEPPAGIPENTFYFVRAEHADGQPFTEEGLFPPPPPPPPPPLRVGGAGPFPVFAVQGIRVIRPGDRATAEDIQRFREALGEHTQIEVDQTDDGVIQRITVQARRLLNEADTIRSLNPAPAAESPATTDRVD
ncbi:MAG TPA: M56 family metallopeptidase [Terriglobia bacterium]|nr:M56 family metallopeptidase [Terriglobia bacterium]